MVATALTLRSLGMELNPSPTAFGELRDSSDIVGDAEALRHRMRDDGYVFLRNYLSRDEVLAARREVIRRLDADGYIDRNHPLDGAVSVPGKTMAFSGEYGNNNPSLERVLYRGPMMTFYERLFGEPVRHYDFTWLRRVSGHTQGTAPHADVVYMGRGTWELYTSWTPLGDIDWELGGLMILEGSIHQTNRLRKYLQSDVDTYCVNSPDAADIASGRKLWQWGGVLTDNPVSLQQHLGGRWLTTEFRMGDVLMFSVLTIHASLDNQTNRFRLSSDSRYQRVRDPIDERWIRVDGQPPVGHGVAGKRGRIC